MSRSSFCGVIDEFPLIRVDNFENASVIRAGAYFLSHCHSDHTQGLYSSELLNTLEMTGACIYMSEASAAIVEDEAFDKRLIKFVRPLKTLKTKLIEIPEHSQDGVEKEMFNVRLLPAAHCLGSVMFLFEDTKKTVLYTGDFRLSTSDVDRMIYFHKQGTDNEPLKIDAMYVDTTFIDDRYAAFPKRSDSVEIIADEISRHLRKHKANGRVALHTSAKYGYECVFNDIYNKLGLQVYVNEDRWKVYSKIQHLVKGVTNNSDGVKIHNCRFRWSEHLDHKSCMPASGENNNNGDGQESDQRSKLEYLYIHFSALKWTDYEVEGDTFNKLSDNRIDVCFATHCSSAEVRYFVEYFSPKKVVGFPNEYRNYNSPVKRVDLDIPQVTPKKRKLDNIKREEKRVSRELLMKMFQF